jgi:hypothetical protein
MDLQGQEYERIPRTALVAALATLFLLTAAVNLLCKLAPTADALSGMINTDLLFLLLQCILMMRVW